MKVCSVIDKLYVRCYLQNNVYNSCCHSIHLLPMHSIYIILIWYALFLFWTPYNQWHTTWVTLFCWASYIMFPHTKLKWLCVGSLKKQSSSMWSDSKHLHWTTSINHLLELCFFKPSFFHIIHHKNSACYPWTILSTFTMKSLSTALTVVCRPKWMLKWQSMA